MERFSWKLEFLFLLCLSSLTSLVLCVMAHVRTDASDWEVLVPHKIDTIHLPREGILSKLLPILGRKINIQTVKQACTSELAGYHPASSFFPLPMKAPWWKRLEGTVVNEFSFLTIKMCCCLTQRVHPSCRHGRQHTIMPSNVNYQANMWALKEEGCTHVLVTTACGSLREEIQPGDIVIIDQFIDRTTRRPQTFYDGSHSCARGVCHVSAAEPFCPKTREVLTETAKKLGLRCHSKGTMITIEGPRFSSRAESFMFRTWGADVINMTTVPEVVLAKEAGLCYASIAMATDYDCWKEHEEAVSVDRVLKTLKENANKATSLLLTTIPQIGSMEWSETLHNLKNMAQFSVLLPRH